MYDDLLKKFRENTEKMKALNEKLKEQINNLQNLIIELKMLGDRIKNRRLCQEDILN